MMKIVYFGMGFLPDQNAVANREQVIAQLSKDIGYQPVLIGINRDLKHGEYKRYYINNILCYDIKYPENLKEKFFDIFIFNHTIKNILIDIDLNDIKCFIMQDYQFSNMKKIYNFLKKNQIPFIPDIMDWFVPSKDAGIVKNLIKSIDTYLRMYFFYPKLDNRICISHSFSTFFQKFGINSFVLPCTSINMKKAELNQKHYKRKKLFFAGNPGLKFEKEKLDWVIKAMHEIQMPLELYIFGIDKEDAIKNNPSINKYINNNIHFNGIQPREKCLKVLERSDFSLIIRKKSKLSIYGFSSKICESFSMGIPVLATDVGDNKLYIKDMVNGFIAYPSYNSVKEMLIKIAKLDDKEMLKLKFNIRNNNDLDYHHYLDEFNKFIQNL